MTTQSTETGRPMRYAATSTNWREEAVCATVDPDLFFPSGTGGQVVMQRKAAKRVCVACPVRPQCLESALKAGEPSGVWGGLDSLERSKLRRGRAVGIQWCRDNQELIEERRAVDMPLRQIARELGVAPDAVRRVVRETEAAAARELEVAV